MTAVEGTYSVPLIITYIAISAVASLTSILHIVVTMRSIIENFVQIRTGNLLMRDSLQTSRSASVAPASDAFADKKQSQEMFNNMRFKLEMLHKTIKSDTSNIFVCLTEDVPFFVLNFVAMEQAKASGHATSRFVLLSLLVNCMSMGWKGCIVKEFLSHLHEKKVLIAYIEQIARETECDDVREQANTLVVRQHKMSIISKSSKLSMRASVQPLDFKGAVVLPQMDDDNQWERERV